MPVLIRLATALTLLLAPLAQPLMAGECASEMPGHSAHEHDSGTPDRPADSEAHTHRAIGDAAHSCDSRSERHGPESSHHAAASCAHAGCGISLPHARDQLAGPLTEGHASASHPTTTAASVDLSQDPPPPRLPG